MEKHAANVSHLGAQHNNISDFEPYGPDYKTERNC